MVAENIANMGHLPWSARALQVLAAPPSTAYFTFLRLYTGDYLPRQRRRFLLGRNPGQHWPSGARRRPDDSLLGRRRGTQRTRPRDLTTHRCVVVQRWCLHASVGLVVVGVDDDVVVVVVFVVAAAAQCHSGTSDNMYVSAVFLFYTFFNESYANPLEISANIRATSNNIKLVRWPSMGGLLDLVQQGGDWAGPHWSITTANPSVCLYRACAVVKRQSFSAIYL